MSSPQLTVHRTTKKAPPDTGALHMAAAFRCMDRFDATGNRSDLLKVVNHGVRAVKAAGKKGKKLTPQRLFWVCFTIQNYIAKMTPRELMQVFPPEKTYDGAKWQCKDYFSSKEAITSHGLDAVIGEAINDFLWDYMNRDMVIFEVAHMGSASDLYRQQTGVGIMEQWAVEQGIPLYTMHTDPATGKQFMFNGEDGRTVAVHKPLPRHLKLVE